MFCCCSSESDSDIESVNLNSSCESLEVKSESELDKSRERDTTGQNWNYTMDKNSLMKGFRSKEVEFLRDLSATYCGILHQRRMLAVWQKRFCKVKDQSLLCYRYVTYFLLCLLVFMRINQFPETPKVKKAILGRGRFLL